MAIKIINKYMPFKKLAPVYRNYHGHICGPKSMKISHKSLKLPVQMATIFALILAKRILLQS